MLTFHKIRWKNFLSTGNSFIDIELDKTKTTLIVGANGHGKSTILDALTFVLFGKPFRKINKPDLCNSINNSDCLVEIEFTVYGKRYKIVRGLKPNVFEIYCDGFKINQDASARDYQSYLEKHILKMNMKSFTQIVVLGSASFTPFMQLTPNDRRIIIEDLLDIQIFSTMLVLAKQSLQINRESFERNRLDLISTNEKLAYINKSIKSLKKTETDREKEILDKIEEQKASISVLEMEIKDIEEKISNLETHLIDDGSLADKEMSMITMRSKIEGNRNRTIKENSFFHSHDKCSVCKQNIEEGFKSQIIGENDKKILELETGLNKINAEISIVTTSIQKMRTLRREISDLYSDKKHRDQEISFLKKNITEQEADLTRLKASNQVVVDHQDELKVATQKLEDLEKEKQTLLADRAYYEASVSLLKDTGIKSKIIKQYIPIMNKCINTHLAKMGFFVNFEIDENFNEIIKSRYLDEFSYNNFSEGEKTRIDLALLFTWRSISKMKNSVNTNLLILDEILDGSLDANGTDEFLKIIKQLSDGTNTFIISHKQDQLIDKFDRVYKFVKIKNFSRIET